MNTQMQSTNNTATNPTITPLTTRLEHINITVADPEKTAAMLTDLFGWAIRWKGASKLGGHTVHVGLPGLGDDYLAIYTTPKHPSATARRTDLGGLNHVGLVVDDLDEAERRVIESGYEIHTRADYEPGRRFYFDDHDGIEYEITSYI